MDMPEIDPEKLEEEQKQQCIFCQILEGKIASKKVFEDDICTALLDINPANPGHVLILPKEHHSIMQLMPEEQVQHLFRVAKRISKAQIKVLGAESTNIFVANGAAAGQKAPHFMIHVIPRKENDGITCFEMPKNQINEEDQVKLCSAIKSKYEERFGFVGEPEEGASEEDDAMVEQSPEQENEPQHIPPPEQTESKEPEQEKEIDSEEDVSEPDRSDSEEAPPEQEKDEPDPSAFNVPPPEPHHDTKDDDSGKKGFDLDKIGGLFK